MNFLYSYFAKINSKEQTKCDEKNSLYYKQSFIAHLECTAQFHCLAQYLPGSAAEDCEFH